MTITQLEYALALLKFGSFKKAADKKGISQPGLSLQVQKLEQEIGVILFDRTSNPVQPTIDGKAFLARAQELVTEAHKLKHFTSELSTEFKGTLKVGIIPTLGPFLVSLFAEALQKDFPDFHLDIREQITEKVVADVRSGDLDVGIISTPVKAHGIISMPLFYEKFLFYSAEKTPYSNDIRIKDIDYKNLWLLNEGNCFRDQVNNFCDFNKIRKDKTFIYRSNSIDALIRLVDTKGGMTILPELTTLTLSKEQEEFIKELNGKPKAREIGIIVTKSHTKARFIEKLTEYIRNNIPKHMLTKDNLEIVDPDLTF